MLEIEVCGIEVFGYHGVNDEERRVGQPFLFDVWLTPTSLPRDDAIGTTVDYREVVALVRRVSDRRPVKLIETLAADLADELIADLPLDRVRVRVRKPRVRLDPPAEYTAAIVERAR